jgi:short-subunit dehydrogenase
VLLWRLAQQSTRVTLDKVRRVASQLWFHLPPGMPPFVLLALVPRRVIPTTITADTMAESAAIVQRAVPLWTDPFVRTIALSGLGLAIMSWAHYEIHRQRRLTPLPLAAPYRDLSRVVLPPFLPQEVPTSWMEDITTPDSMLSDKDVDGMNDDDEDTTVKGDARSYLLPPYLQKHVNSLLGPGATPTTSRSLSTTIREWQRMRFQRQSERQRAHRLSILDQLLALQSLKARATRRQPPTPPHNGDDDNDAATSLGYALVTGASRGIGRALAVELARYEIPLILVARDVDRLTALAYDLEACYGISCCVIAADLSRPGQAEQLYRTTQTAGLKVDILINNAGYSMQGQSVDMDVGQTNNLIQLNALSLSTLMHLYGRDMKARRRGRILNVSSICGATAGIPTVGVYAATKSFVNTLSRSLALELEPYGVGVTCVLPGAVKDTEFKARSQSHQAACWKIPFYPKAPQLVASSGIKALLRGETECTPGWENRFFLQVLKPAIPQRIHNLIAEAFWNPIHWPFRTRASPEAPQQQPVEQPAARQTAPAPSPPPMQRVPRLLQLDQVEEKGQSPVDSQVPDKHDEPVEEMEEPAVATEDQVDGTTEADANSVPEESTSPPPLPQEEHLPLDHEPAMVSRDRASSFRPLAFLRSREVPATHKKKD